MNSQPEQLYAIVRGQVQGVNFRSATQAQARRLGLVGWVRNQPDGSVEVLAEGPRAALDKLLAFLRRGPPAARVGDVQPEWRPVGPPQGQFEVRW